MFLPTARKHMKRPSDPSIPGPENKRNCLDSPGIHLGYE